MQVRIANMAVPDPTASSEDLFYRKLVFEILEYLPYACKVAIISQNFTDPVYLFQVEDNSKPQETFRNIKA